MRPQNDIQRTLARATLTLHRQMETRREAAKHYGMGEREQQFQHPFSGKLGTFPVSVTFKILFDILFLGDAGVRRDSQLDEPQSRFGFRLTSAAEGTMVSAHVASWIRDDGFNYVGANVTLTVHNPTIAFYGPGSVPSLEFQGVIHCSFQGYGVPLDPDEASIPGQGS